MNLSQVSEIYENAGSLTVDVYVVSDTTVEAFIKSTTAIFRLIDRDDELQVEISHRMWRLRAAVLYTLRLFSDSDLGILDQANQLVEHTSRYSHLQPSALDVFDRVNDLINLQVNPKRIFLEKLAAKFEGCGLLLTKMSNGGSPGWPNKDQKHLDLSARRVGLFRTAVELNSPVPYIIIPGAIRTIPSELVQKIFFSGVTSKIIVCTYPHESFKLPPRLDMSLWNILRSPTPLKGVYSIESSNNSTDVSEVDDWINDQFWTGLHGGEREKHVGKEPSRYVLFANGMGCFFPEDGTVLSTRNVSRTITDSDFRNTRVTRLSDGDWVLLRDGHVGTNLDQTSDRLLEELGEEELLEIATDWKTALDALTLTKSLHEISSGIESYGSKVTARTLQLWCNGQVLGPANQVVFNSLIRYLASQGKIRNLALSVDDYISLRWRQLQEFRGLRHKAGNIIRNELIGQLVTSICEQGSDSLSCDEFRISNDGSSSVVLLRVEMVDNTTSYVSHSRYGQLDDLRGNRWLA